MGRKIPAKKHRGVKDPAQQQARRLQSLKGKINAPPKDPDEQPVPRSLTQLFAFREPKTERHVKKKKQKKFGNSSGDQNSSLGGKNPISKMKKLPGESGRSFSLRINSAIKALHGVGEQEDYPSDMEDDEDVKGDRMEAQRRRRERKRKRAGNAAGADAEPPPPSRAQRLALKKQAKKQREIEAKQEKREVVYERVGFGEVAHAPPVLVFKSKKAGKDEGAPRPGRRELLLSKMLQGSGAAGGAGAGAGAAADKRARARALPAAERARLERARQQAVDAYRALKANALKKPRADTT